MSKNDTKVATTTNALSRAIGEIVKEAGGKITKSRALNTLAKEIAGPKHNWGFLTSSGGNHGSQKSAETRTVVFPGYYKDEDPYPVEMSREDAINIRLGLDGRGFRPVEAGPVKLDIHQPTALIITNKEEYERSISKADAIKSIGKTFEGLGAEWGLPTRRSIQTKGYQDTPVGLYPNTSRLPVIFKDLWGEIELKTMASTEQIETTRVLAGAIELLKVGINSILSAQRYINDKIPIREEWDDVIVERNPEGMIRITEKERPEIYIHTTEAAFTRALSEARLIAANPEVIDEIKSSLFAGCEDQIEMWAEKPDTCLVGDTVPNRFMLKSIEIAQPGASRHGPAGYSAHLVFHLEIKGKERLITGGWVKGTALLTDEDLKIVRKYEDAPLPKGGLQLSVCKIKKDKPSWKSKSNAEYSIEIGSPKGKTHNRVNHYSETYDHDELMKTVRTADSYRLRS